MIGRLPEPLPNMPLTGRHFPSGGVGPEQSPSRHDTKGPRKLKERATTLPPPPNPVRLSNSGDLPKPPPLIPTLEEDTTPIPVLLTVDTGDEPPVEQPTTVLKPNNPGIGPGPVVEQLRRVTALPGGGRPPEQSGNNQDNKPNTNHPHAPTSPTALNRSLCVRC